MISVEPPFGVNADGATSAIELPSGDWIYEIKFDGYRALAYEAAVKHECYPATKRIWAPNFQK